MIQVNLLPDLKIEYLKAQRTKRLVLFIMSTATMAVLAITLLSLSYVLVAQPQHTKHVERDIDKLSEEFQSIDNIVSMVTIQKQLEVLPSLHSEKVKSSRLPDFLTKLTPGDIVLNKVELDFESNSIIVTGNGMSVKAVNTFADTFKNAIYSYSVEDNTPNRAFSNVTLNEIDTGENGAAGFKITSEFDPTVFDFKSNVDLQVPKVTSSSAVREGPSGLFQVAPAAEVGQ